MMKTFSITGWSGSGKTTLMTRLISHFSQKGKRVVAVKHAPHHYELEPSTKDTSTFLAAGSSKVYLASQTKLLTMHNIANQEEIFALLKQEVTPDKCDLLLLEGLQNESIPKIEVFNASLGQAPKFPFNQLVALVTDTPLTDAIPSFNRDNINDIATFMEVYHE